HRFGGIGRIKLSTKLGSGMKFVQRSSCTNCGLARGNVQPSELLHRDEPTTVRDPPTSQSAATSGDGDWRLLGARRAELFQEFGFVFGYANTLGIAFGPTRVFKIAPAHRIFLVGFTLQP